MPRYKLKEAREKAGLTQSALAELIGAERKAVNYWEAGTASPRGIYREKILEVLKPVLKEVLTDEDNDLFKNYPERLEGKTDDLCPQVDTKQQLVTPCQTEPTRDILKSTDPPPFVIHIPGSARGFKDFMDIVRRQFIEVVARLGLTASLGNINLALVSSPTVDPQEYLSQCSFTLNECWGWLSQGDYQKVERALQLNVTPLTRFANTFSPFQNIAASLATEALIMQAFLASRKLDYGIREILCAEAVQIGALSGNRRIRAIALEWQGYTYTNSASSYLQPQRAISIFERALSGLGSDATLNRANSFIGLSLAYAQDPTQENYETRARDYAEQARESMPPLPEQDPFHRCIDLGHSELDELEGQMYLHLAEYTSNRSYAEAARDLLEKSMNKQAWKPSYRIGKLVKRADVARALGELHSFVDSLDEGFHIAQEIASLRGMGEACDVMNRIPAQWKQETAIQNLQKELSVC